MNSDQASQFTGFEWINALKDVEVKSRLFILNSASKVEDPSIRQKPEIALSGLKTLRAWGLA